MGKPAILRIPPEASGMLPVHIPFRGIKDRLFIDFKGVRDLDSTGLNILLYRLLNQLGSIENIQYDLSLPDFSGAAKLLQNSNFEYFLRKSLYGTNINQSNPIFSTIVSHNKSSPIKIEFYNNIKYCYPIYFVNFSEGADRRKHIDAIEDFVENILDKHKIKINKVQFFMVLKEMLKNSADHTEDNAYFGIDILETKHGKPIEISFSYGDMGIGIGRSVYKALSLDHEEESWTPERIKHINLSEAYFFALRDGYSSKPGNKINLGLGMPLIWEGAKGLKMELSVFDMQSRCVITRLKDKTNYNKIRECLYPIGHRSYFGYIGKVPL